jgi:hypothetical protein
MPNKNRNKLNQPPTGEGKKQSPFSGEENKLSKRSEVAQAQRNPPEENSVPADQAEALTPSGEQRKDNAKRQKAGR